MVSILSPSKTSAEKPLLVGTQRQPALIGETGKLMEVLKNMSADDIKSLMKTSDNLTQHTLKLIAELEPKKFTPGHRSALFSFSGGVYQGLRSSDFTEEDLLFAQDHLRILSGLYGVLRPLDAIQVYRLEMGSSLKTPSSRSLYAFWGDKITDELNDAIGNSGSSYLLNLASDEYFQSISSAKLKATVIHAEFYSLKGGERKFISFDAKKARGLMARFVIKNRIDDPSGLQYFNYEGYRYAAKDSTPNSLIFEKEA